MVTEIGERISVTAAFDNGRLRPMGFTWRGRKYRISYIFSSFYDRQGSFVRFHYAVGTGSGDVFEITLDSHDMIWELVRIHSGG